MPSTRHPRTQSLTPDIEVQRRLSEPLRPVKSSNPFEAERSTVMADNSVTQNGPSVLQAGLNYLVYNGEKPVSHVTTPGEAPIQRTATYQEHDVLIRDGRSLQGKTSLDREGFVFTTHASGVADFYDHEEVTKHYYPEIENLVIEATGARRVHAFDHNVRADLESKRREMKVREPVTVVHNDYTERSGPQRVRDLLPDEADALLRTRFAFFNVWRPILGPVQTAPLAVCDAQSIKDGDLIPTDLKYGERTGEVSQSTYNPGHRWFYFPLMERDEVLLIKCYDSQKDGRSRFTAHTAFTDPNTASDAPGRESIETRTIAFF